MAWKRRGNKFGAQRAESSLSGRSFHSQAERNRADMLVLLEKGGVISQLEFQPQVYLSAAQIGYKPDFRYIDERGMVVYEEVKGVETEGWLVRQKLWGHYGPAELRVLREHAKGFRLLRTIHPKLNDEPGNA